MKWFARVALLSLLAALPSCKDDNNDDAAILTAIMSKGGTGSTGTGGNGGYFYFEAYNTHMKMLKSGAVNTAVTIPAPVPYLGTNPRTITANTTLAPVAVLTGLNQILEGAQTGTIWGDDSATAATGLWVKPGVTLTVEANYDGDNDDLEVIPDPATGNYDIAYLGFANGVYIEGTVVVGKKNLSTVDSADLYIDGDSVVTTAAAQIKATGVSAAAAGTDGGDGGYVELNAVNTIINRGTVNTSGGSGDDGGAGGDMGLYADNYTLANAGTLITSGGAGTDGAGGAGGTITLGAANGTGGACINSGTLTTTGGNGTTGGGAGGHMDIYTDDLGAVVNSGTLNASGGNATTTGDGGDGGDVDVDACGGIRFAGTVITRGGNATAGAGGAGGYFEVYNDEDNDYVENEYTPAGFYVGANIDTGGGNGTTSGGAAGYVDFYNDNEYCATPEIENCFMVGYSAINTSGGAGQTDGGAGGDIDIDKEYGYDDNSDYQYGDFVNEIPLTTCGGAGETGDGGDGGYVDMCCDYYCSPSMTRTWKNSGAIDTRGGAGAVDGGYGGYVYMYDFLSVTNTASVNTSGGAAGTGTGGTAGEVEMYSDDILTNSGTVTANGGASTSGVGGAATKSTSRAARLRTARTSPRPAAPGTTPEGPAAISRCSAPKP